MNGIVEMEGRSIEERIAYARENLTEAEEAMAAGRYLDAMVILRAAEGAASEASARAMREARRNGSPWEMIGKRLGGISKQAAQQKYGPIIGN